MYIIKVDEKEKVFSIIMSGFMTESESKAYIRDFKLNVRSILPSQYSIIVDTQDMKTASQNLIPLMLEAQELIVTTPFKKRYSIMPKSAVAEGQIERVGKEDNVFDNTILAQSYDEVIRVLHKETVLA